MTDYHNRETHDNANDKYTVKILPTHKNSTELGYKSQFHLNFHQKQNRTNQENKNTAEFDEKKRKIFLKRNKSQL